ncbi:MAG TPA: putative Ig domain-containing protein [Syntrophobacteria bacterium]|nr:putative Ig domain-containing protein [Syntrophobacteria bacterium]
MNNRVLLVLLISVLLGCGQQSGGSSPPAETPGPAETAVAIAAVRVLPEHPTPQSTLEAKVRFSGGQPEQVAYQWLRNGMPLPGAIGATLVGEQLRKGDFIAVQVRIGQGEPAKSDPVVIGNTPPQVTWVEISPKQPTSSDTLEAVASGTDRDHDQLIYAYTWAVNGGKVIGQNGPSLDKSHFRRGDQVQVTVAPFDGSDWGKEVTGPGVVIGNSPPMIVSTPPSRLESDPYRYEVKAEDADGDPIRFSLRGNVPPGMKIDEATGVVEWKVVVPKEATTWEYEVVAQDPGGLRTVQKITLKYTPPS